MGKNSKDIVFTSAVRTAIGKYNGMWNNFQAHDLGKIVIKEIRIPEKFLNKNLLENQSLRSEFKDWVNSLWLEKDLLLSKKD